MIKLTIALPLDEDLENQCAAFNTDESKVPSDVVRAAARQGMSLAGYKLTKVQHDWGTMHFTFTLDTTSEFVTLPAIPFTEDNFDPLHGPPQVWWVSIMRAGAKGPNILEPDVVDQVKAALGGLDLTGKEVHRVCKSMQGYQITVRRDVLNAPVPIGFDKAVEGQEATVKTLVEKSNSTRQTRTPETRDDQGLVSKALDSVFDALTIGSLLD